MIAGLRIASLCVYPVKGCRGLAVTRADVRVTGLATRGVGDREWMVIDRDGRFVTQRERPRLALVAPSVADHALVLSAPGAGGVEIARSPSPRATRDVVVWNSVVRAFDEGDDAARWLSQFLGADVRLVRFDAERRRPCNPHYVGDSGAHTLFADGYPILVIGQSSLDDLNARLAARGESALPMDRFRPNVVVEGLAPGDEDHLDTLTAGGVTLRLVKPCARCQVTTTDQATGRVGVEPLPTLSTYRRNDALAAVLFGMNAIVVGGEGLALDVGAAATAEYRF